jgi:transposase, IS30 family
MEEKKYKRLSIQERVIIQTLLEEKRSKSFIASKLNRSRSTITREINKWVQHPGETYNADLANWNAKDDYLNKRNLDKIGTYNSLKFYVYKGLINQWSPEQISGRIKDDYPNNPIMSISYEAIYMHIYTHPQEMLNQEVDSAFAIS